MTEVASLGAHILNDIRGFEMPGALEAAAATDCGPSSSCTARPPRTTRMSWRRSRPTFRKGKRLLEGLGVSADRICWDPGFGFGKTVEQNFALLGSTERFVASGQPYLMGLSRKSSIGAATGHKAPMDRIAGSISPARLSPSSRAPRSSACMTAARPSTPSPSGARPRRPADAGKKQPKENNHDSSLFWYGRCSRPCRQGADHARLRAAPRSGRRPRPLRRQSPDGTRDRASSARTRAFRAYMLEAALQAGFSSAGVDIVLCGPIPTPAVAYLTPRPSPRRGRGDLREPQSVRRQRH